MPDTTGTQQPPVGGMAADRRAAFEAEISRIQRKAGRAASERRFIVAGVAAMVAGVAIAIVAFLVSLGQADTRDVISLGILGVAGLTVSVVGAAVFLRYGIGRFLRFWLLRLLYERDADED